MSTSQILRGTPVSSGIAHGTAFVMTRANRVVVPLRSVEEAEVAGELVRFEAALNKAETQLIALRKDVAERIGAGEADIFAAQALVVRSGELHDQVVAAVHDKRINVEAALAEVIERFIRAFDQISDAYIRERAADIRDVGRRVFAALIAEDGPNVRDIPEGSILVATSRHDLSDGGRQLLQKGQGHAISWSHQKRRAQGCEGQVCGAKARPDQVRAPIGHAIGDLVQHSLRAGPRCRHSSRRVWGLPDFWAVLLLRAMF